MRDGFLIRTSAGVVTHMFLLDSVFIKHMFFIGVWSVFFLFSFIRFSFILF